MTDLLLRAGHQEEQLATRASPDLSKKLHPFATYAFPFTVTLKMQLTWDLQIIQVMLIHVSMHFPWKGKQELLPFPRTVLLKLSCQPAHRALLCAHTIAQECHSCAATDNCTFGDRQKNTGTWNIVPGAWLSGYGRFCKCFLIWLVTCITPKISSHLSAAYLWKLSSNAGCSLVCFLLQLFPILKVNICSYGSKCRNHVNLTSRQCLKLQCSTIANPSVSKP